MPVHNVYFAVVQFATLCFYNDNYVFFYTGTTITCNGLIICLYMNCIFFSESVQIVSIVTNCRAYR